MEEEGIESSAVVVVDAPEHVAELCDFLRRLDYGAEQVDDRRIVARLPDAWPTSLGRTALDHFIRAWNRAHPEQYVAVENDRVHGRNAA